MKVLWYNKNLINEIKSFFNLKEIFSFCNRKKFLNIIIYNKQLQKKLRVNILDYKKLSKICKIVKKDGRGKEFIINTNKLIFEGEYLNRKRNGKGKEYYDDGKLKFEGEYLNDIRWNGKGYNKNGIIVFQIKNGYGKGKEYNNHILWI